MAYVIPSTVVMPTVSTSAATSITATGVTFNGEVTNDGGATVTERGFVYATSSNPTTSDTKIQDGNGTGAFEEAITGLTAETTYYVRAYAINSEGTSYGDEVSFTTDAPSVLLNANPTISFSNDDGFSDSKAVDGEGGSVSISDIDIEVYPINSSGTALTADPLEYHDSDDWPSYPPIVTYGATLEHYGWAIKSANGDNFSLESLDFMDWGTWDGATFIIEAFDNGSSKDAVTFAGNTDESYVHLSQLGILSSAFTNVDEIRFYKQGGDDTWTALNNIEVNSPVIGVLATVTTTAASGITATSATLGGEVTDNGGATVTDRGIVYNTTGTPTTSDTKVQIGDGDGSFSDEITGLTAETEYFVRAYAINSEGTSYGTEESFTTASSIIVTTFSGDLEDDLVFKRPEPDNSDYTAQLLPTDFSGVSTTDYNYFIRTITPEVTGDYSIEVTNTTGFSDSFLLVYSSFDPSSPLTGLMIANDDHPDGGLKSKITSINLMGGTTYSIVMTSYSSGDVGNVTFEVSGPSSVEVEEVVDEPILIPTVATDTPSEVTATSAILGGEVSDDGGAAINERGVVWATTSTPLTSDNKVTMGTGVGAFSQTVGSLPPNTTLYVRSFATNSEGTAYGSEISFETLKHEQSLTFPEIASKTYGDESFTLGDEETDKGLTVTYTSADPTIISITNNQAVILKAGTTTVTATQEGNDTNLALTPIEREIVIDKAALTLTADDKSKVYGEENPALTFSYTGLVNGDTEVSEEPGISTTATGSSSVGTYPVTLTGGSDANYDISLAAGELEVTQAALTITADDKSKIYGEANPTLTFTYTGLVNGDTEVSTEPGISTTATESSNVGT
ncbi:MBG domain-containing protein, partial [Cyclobacterium sp. SYSU L10401]|uniref:MBG domain-containing protein n=1 Tax=Cyclobacterium sp. SYSU L10401 TaxID=2678657 RepID=UPI001969ED76